MALQTRDIDYPDDGVRLGQGWDSVGGHKKDIIAISFANAQDTGQEKRYEITHATERNKLMNELDVSVEAQYKYLTYKVGAKAKFSDKVTTSGTFESFTTLATVKNGVLYTAPIHQDQSPLVSSLLGQGKTPDEVNKALKIDPVAHSKKYPLKSLIEPAANALKVSEEGIWLSGEAVALAKQDREKFRQRYGDCFVYAIYGGAQLNVVMTFKTSSVEEQQKIAASLEASAWGLDIKGEAVKTMERYAEQSKLEIKYFQQGGSGDPMPTDVKGFLEKIHDLPGLAEKAPVNYKITLKKYDSLPNWPGSAFNGLVPAYGHIVRKFYEYRDLFEEIDYIKGHSDEYVLGKNLLQDQYPGITLTALEEVQDELQAGIRDLLDLLQRNKEIEDHAKYEMPTSASKPDYEFRVAMPLPHGYKPQGYDADFSPWDRYKKAVCDKWIRPISTIRGGMYSPADPGCLTNEQLHQYESLVYSLAIVGGRIAVPGKPPRTWGEQAEIAKAQELIVLETKSGAKSSFFLRAMPGSYKRVMGIANPGEVLWGKTTDKKEIALYWSDTAYIAFYVGSPGKEPDTERIVGGLVGAKWPPEWGFSTPKIPFIDKDAHISLYIGS